MCITEYLQNGADCLPQFADSGVPCDDGSPSTDNDICDGFGGCLGTPFGCPPASTCTPGYTQQDGECSPNFAEAGTACNDGDATTQQDTCDGSGSCAGEPYECPTTSACVLAYEQDGSGCAPSYAAAGVACDDGIATTSRNTVLQRCYDVPTADFDPTCGPGLVPGGRARRDERAGAGALIGVDSGTSNENRFETQGIDIELAYANEFGPGLFSANLVWNQLLKWDEIGMPGWGVDVLSLLGLLVIIVMLVRKANGGREAAA